MTPPIIETETGLKCVSLQDYRDLERERDEARDKAAQWERISIRLDNERTKLCDIADRAITVAALWAGSRRSSVPDLRAELKRLKEGVK